MTVYLQFKIVSHYANKMLGLSLLSSRLSISMKITKIMALSTAMAFLASCSNSSISEREEVSTEQTTANVDVDTVPQNEATKFSKEAIARYAISTIMGQPSNTIKVQSKDGLYLLSYVRISDSQQFDYRIKFEGNKITWASIDGRWRDKEYDEKLSFEESGNKSKIIQTFSDGSMDIKEFAKAD